MMGLGYLGSSSSSSSSNLSPLAPPFTVDRSNHNKPVPNANSISHFNDPSYGVAFTSSWPYSHPSTARQEFSGDSPKTTTLPSNDCGYRVPEPVNLPTTGNWSGLNSNGKHGFDQITPGRSHWSAVYPSPKRVTDSLSYNLSEAKPFYTSYDDAPLVTLSEPSYDLLSTSGLVHGDETEYTRSLSGLEYNPQQDSVWSAVPEVKKRETDDSFFSEEANMAAYNNYLNQGGYGSERSRKSKSKSKSKDDPSLFYYADIIRRANNSGASCTNNNRLDPNELSTFKAFPMFSESHPLIQSAEAPEDVWNSQNLYNPYEKRYHMFDCSDDHMSASITKSSTLVIKPPAAASKSLEMGSLSGLNTNDGDKALKESFEIGRSEEQVKLEFKAEMTSIPNVNTSGNVKSSEQSAEDSPCWKGAPPASHFLPDKLQTPTKSGPILEDADVDTVKPNKGQTPETHVIISPGDDATLKSVNASAVVKSLSNLSDLLLLNQSAFKEHDRQALHHVIRNLRQALMTPHHNTSTVFAHEETTDKSATFVDKLLEQSSLRVEADPPNMVQAIKKVLDDNLECKLELPSETLLYKNLWLEAEAELCSLSFRARFERLKRQTDKSKSTDAAAAIKDISSCKIPPKPIIHKDDDAIEASVMARFNILKRRQHPNPAANLEDVGGKGSQATVVGKDMDPCWVMDRFNILKRRDVDVEEKEVRDCGKEGPMGAHFQDEEEEEEVGSGGSDWEHVLKDEFSWRLS